MNRREPREMRVEAVRAPGFSDEECTRRLQQVYRWLLGIEPWPTTAPAPTEVTIYALSDPRTHEVRYVGQTHNDLDLRLKQHLSQAGRGQSAKDAWLRELRGAGLRPQIVSLERVSVAHAHAAESRHIARERAAGSNLLN